MTILAPAISLTHIGYEGDVMGQVRMQCGAGDVCRGVQGHALLGNFAGNVQKVA